MHLITLILLNFFGFFNSTSGLETTYFVKDSFIYEIRNDSLFKISPDDYRIVSYSKLENYDNIDLLDYETLNYDSTHFYKKTGGLLYQLVDNKIIRIDNSYDHKLHLHSLKFFYNNQIHILGGYGFFDRRKDIVYFSDLKKEWFSKKLKGIFPERGISEINFHLISKENLIFCGGLTYNKLDNSLTDKVNECYNINLKTLTTQKLSGTLNKEFSNITNDYIQIGNQLWVFYDNSLSVLDSGNLSGYSYPLDYSVGKVIGIIDGEIYFKERNSSINSSIGSLKISDFTKSKGSFVEVLSNPFNSLIYLLFFTLFIIIIYFWKRKNSIKKIPLNFLSDGIMVNNIRFTDNDQWNLVIQQLKENNTLKNDELLNLLQNNNFDIGHQNRLKNTLITSINQRANDLTNQDLILKSKWEKDNRINVYSLNQEFFEL